MRKNIKGEPKVLFYNAHLVDSQTDRRGAVLAEGGFIKAIYTEQETLSFLKTIAEDVKKVNVCNRLLMPSFIDMHVHLRYPGQSEKETLKSGLAAAVAGGFGTLVLMPNTRPVVSDPVLALSIQKEANSLNIAKVIQTLSITRDFCGTDTSHLDRLQGFPMITEDGYDVRMASFMFEAMKKCTAKGIIAGCHCEDHSLAKEAQFYRERALEGLKGIPAKFWADKEVLKNPCIDNKKIDSLLKKANQLFAMAEDIATERNIGLAFAANCRIHINHVSTKNAIDTVRRWKLRAAKKERGHENFEVSCEISPHHFSLSGNASKILRYIVNPPLKSSADHQALLSALADGTADVIATDHAPHTAEDKARGAPGFSGLETAFAVANTELVRSGTISLCRLSELMSAKPAHILGLKKQGRLFAGYEANFVIADADYIWRVDSSKFKTQGKICPFEGKKVYGKIFETWYAGRQVYDSTACLGK